MTTRTHPRRVLFLGALSAIGEATARLFAQEGAVIGLVGRGDARLKTVAGDLEARGASRCHTWDVDLSLGPTVDLDIQKMAEAMGGELDACVVLYGILGDQNVAEHDISHARDILRTNFSSTSEWALDAANLLERQNSGSLVVVGSVAGDRGRRSNYIYGAAKGGLAILLDGLAHRLAASKASVVNIKPGFVDTPMTAHMNKSGPLWSKPSIIATAIKTAIDRGRSANRYSPWFWRWIMLVIRLIPSSIFNKTKL